MSFAWLFESNFSPGDNSEWDSESDTGSLLDFPHYSDLARIPGMGMPYRGAYCARIVMGDTNDHTLTAGDVNISSDGTFGVRFALFIGNDITASADDTFNILELKASATIELAIGLRITASTDVIEIGVGEVTPTSFSADPLTRGNWYQIEVHGDLDNAGANDGAATLRVDGGSVATIATLDQGAITDAVLGTQLTEATTLGTLLFDEFVADDTRVGIIADRWPEEILLTKTGHVFVGRGEVENVTLLSGNAGDCILDVYDTDKADASDIYNTHARLLNTAANEVVDPAGMPVSLRRGCYVVLAGTTPRAIVKLKNVPAWGSEGAVRMAGLGR